MNPQVSDINKQWLLWSGHRCQDLKNVIIRKYWIVQLFLFVIRILNLQATKLTSIYCDTGYQGGGGYHPLRFSVWFKLSYRVIQRLIQHWLLSKMVYSNVKYVIATRSYGFLFIYAKSHWKSHFRGLSYL